ncbi:MAG: hypothetical protein OEV30_11780, partial [Ignavibacteria bacterium]|nr:hypothetical protein [Ignavibacteria bacterium]
ILNLPVQFGTDSGIQRTFVITRDEFRSAPVVNGTPYYFAVTAYNYTAENQPIKTLESPPLIITAIPGQPNPGTRYPYAIGDTLSTVVNVVGTNDAVVNPVIFTPTRQFGETFEVHFDTLTGGSVIWNLLQAGVPDTIVNGMPVTTDTTIRLVNNGFTVSVSPSPQGVRSVTDGNGDAVFGPTGIPEGAAYRLLGKSTDINGLAGGGTNTGRNYEIRMTTDSSYVVSIANPTFLSKVIKVPFRVFDLQRSSEETPVERMAVVRDHGSTPDTWNVSNIPLVQGGTTFTVFEPMYISTIPYVADDPNTPTREDSAAVKAAQNNLIAVANATTNVRNAVDSVYFADLDDDGVAAPAGTSTFVSKFLEIRAGDIKAIQLESVTTGDVTIARDDVTLVNVFPNPYYGLNTRETSSQARYVTFNHLPSNATIRIFNLAGVLVRTLNKDATTTNPTSPQHFQWNLQNQNGLPVASGIYLIHIEMKDTDGVDLGSKILKLAIIQEQQFLPNY